MKESVRKLWDLCFTDSKEFTDLYFNLRYKDDINIAIEEKGQLISALQMIPYSMSFYGHRWKTSYISGACTYPNYRAKGAMRQLLNNSFKQMYAQGDELCTLIPAEPWLFNYYQKAGFASIFKYSTKKIDCSLLHATTELKGLKIEKYSQDAYNYFNKKQQNRRCALLHTEEDFKVIYADIAIGSGGVYIAIDGNTICGIAIAYERENFIEVNECMYDSDDSLTTLYQTIQNDYPQKHLVAYIPSSNEDTTQLGMARIINAHKVLNSYAAAFPHISLIIKVNDEAIIDNNNFFQLKNGACKVLTKAPSTTFQSFDISDLCQYLLAPLYPYMNLMLN